MENMDKRLNVPKWLKVPQMPQNLSARKFWISMKKRLHWAPAVRGLAPPDSPAVALLGCVAI